MVSVVLVPEAPVIILSLRSEKLQNERSPNFGIFRPKVCTENPPNIPPSFDDLSCFVPVKQRPLKIHQKSPPLFTAKSPGKSDEEIPNMSLDSRHCNESNEEASVELKRQSTAGKRPRTAMNTIRH